MGQNGRENCVLVLKKTLKYQEMLTTTVQKQHSSNWIYDTLQIIAHTRLLGQLSWSFDRPVRIGDIKVPSCVLARSVSCRPVEKRDVWKKPYGAETVKKGDRICCQKCTVWCHAICTWGGGGVVFIEVTTVCCQPCPQPGNSFCHWRVPYYLSWKPPLAKASSRWLCWRCSV
jgi:hypothetical protein